MMKIFKHQLWHLLVLLILLWVLIYFPNNDTSLLNGSLWGIQTRTWLIISILSPIIHQIYVVLCWRYELHYKGLSKLFSNTKRAFKIYKIGFAILILSRIVTISILAFSNAKSLVANATFIYVLAFIISIPAIYLFYSVKTYFGMDRAFGLDHFKPDEVKKIPFVKEGIFKYTSNGMYIYGFLILYIPGLILMSKAALLIALFNHTYIWVHYYFTELPDIKFIYKK